MPPRTPEQQAEIDRSYAEIEAYVVKRMKRRKMWIQIGVAACNLALMVAIMIAVVGWFR